MTVALTVYEGAKTIGGNKILLEDGDTAVFLDFGTSFDARSRYFEEFVAPRSRAGLIDLIHMELLPPLRGIYRSDLQDPAGRVWERAERFPHFRRLSVDGVLLSHAHMDHIGYISFLDTGIPIVATAMTAYLGKAIQDCGAHQFEGEMSYATPKIADKDGNIGAAPTKGFPYERRSYLLADKLPDDGGEFWNLSPAPTKSRHFPRKRLKVVDRVAGFDFQYFPVDHSIYGSAAMAIKTSSGWVVYTGDLRRHGLKKASTEAFIQAAKALHPIAMICEGTNIDRGPGATEEEVFVSCLQAVQAAEGEFVVADFGPRNVERLLTFLEIARRTGRRLIVSDKDAYVLTAMRAADPEIPTPASDPHLAVYRRALLKPDNWVKQVREWYPNQVTAPEIGGRPGEYIVCFSFFDITELVDIDPARGCWIYSSSEPHDEEQLFEVQRLEHWLARFHLEPIGLTEGPSRYHSSGHISGPEIQALIREVSPGQVIPVHTQHPQRFVELLGKEMNVRLPDIGAPLVL